MDDDAPHDIAIARIGGKVAGADDRCLARIRAAIRETLRRHDVASAHISVGLMDDARIAQLNEHHLGHTGPTDVLTFDLRDDVTAPIDGDMAISVETAAREAALRRHDVTAELMLYAIHATLHLLGYRDDTEADAARMHEMEDAVLVSLGVGAVYRARAS